MAQAFQRIYTRLEGITKATVVLNAQRVMNDELATVDGRLSQVVKISGDRVTLQVLEVLKELPPIPKLFSLEDLLRLMSVMICQVVSSTPTDVPLTEDPKWKEITVRLEAHRSIPSEGCSLLSLYLRE